MRKPVTALVMAALMMTACGGDDAESADDAGGTTAPSESVATDETTDENSEPATTAPAERDLDALLLTEDDLDVPVSDRAVGIYSMFTDPDAFIAEADDSLRMWDTLAGSTSGEEPVAVGAEAAELLVAGTRGTDDPAGCWSGEPPRIVGAAYRAFGDGSPDGPRASHLTIQLASPDDALRYVDPKPEDLAEGAATKGISWEEEVDGGSSSASRPCTTGPDHEPCASTPSCWSGVINGDQWTVTVVVDDVVTVVAGTAPVEAEDVAARIRDLVEQGS